jgi:chemotaxis protein MotA
MDIATVVGLCLACCLIVGSIILGGAPLTAFIDPPSMMVVVGGAFAAALICFPLKVMLGMPKIMLKVVLNKSEDFRSMVETIVSLAEVARRDGLLALESKLEEVENPFIRMGVQMAVDGTRPEVIESILRTEMDAVGTRHKNGKSILDQIARFAPAYGMIGTLMGLIMMLRDMSDPSVIGKGMAVALITTLYGAIMANVVFMPFAEKLGFMNKQELMGLEIIVRGIMDIQSGENPRVIEQKLNTFLPVKMRTTEEEA